MDIVEQLGARVAYLRKSKKMSQLDLSLEAGVTKNYICDLEHGRRNPSLLTLEKIAKGLGVSVDELLKGLGSFEG